MDDVEDQAQAPGARRYAAALRAEAFVTGVAFGALALAGAILGLVESFLFSWSPGGLPVAAILFGVVNLGLLRAAGWGMGGRLGAVVPACTWLMVLMAFSIKTPSGSLVITGTAAGNILVFGGTVAALLAILWTRSSGDWLLRGTGRDQVSG